MRFCINITVWQRPRVFRNVMRSIRAQETDHDIAIVCALSPDDPYLVENEQTVLEFGAEYVTVQNSPLSNKSVAVCKASKSLELDYMIKLGSDDVISPDLIQATADSLNALGNPEGLGWLDCYFWEPDTDRFCYWAGYGAKRRESMGAGRALRRDVLERLDWQPQEYGQDRNLDSSLTKRLTGIGVELYTSKLPVDAYIVDCKDSVSITPMAAFESDSLTDVPVPECVRGYL